MLRQLSSFRKLTLKSPAVAGVLPSASLALPSLANAACLPSSLAGLLPALPDLQLAEGRRHSNMKKGSSARIGRPRKTRTMRHKEWWVRRNTPHFDYDQSLTKENQNFLQDALREDYKGVQSGDGEDLQNGPMTSSPLKDAPWQPQSWVEGMGTRRCGVLGLKIGVVPQWQSDGKRILCTMFQILDCHVVNYTSPEEWDRQFSYDKYRRISGTMLKALQEKRGIYGVQTVGALSCDPQRFSKEYSGLFTNAGILPKRKLTRYFVTPNAAVKPGTELTAKHFRVGDHVVVEGRTIGRGFQGVMIRWGFAGGPASHGSTKFHRKPGNIGCGRKKRRVNKGKKLPGHMGNEWRTAFNLKIVRINTKHNVIYVKGTTPGPPHAVMRIFDSTHHDQLERCSSEDHPPLPTFMVGVGDDPADQADANGDLFDKTLFDFSKPSITYELKA